MSSPTNKASSHGRKNFFTTVQVPFPDVIEGKINTSNFLEASKGVVELVDRFGGIFAPVKYDMSGNIKKLTEKYETNKERFMYLNDMILIEKQENGNYATDALLWLRRALNFVYTFFKCIREDARKGGNTEDLILFLQKAYEETLKRYHGWMAQQVFGLLAKMCPGRSVLLNTLALGEPDQESEVMEDMDTFLTRLHSNISTLSAFYAQHGLETNIRV
ncbi:glycolipid transfer protein [Schistocerca nitens]|uniref:glycolipid transfer protein n=1 Tax=Schistocerca nitens TaxID=7011 RepID=UPI002119AEE4|nr:glycolipid transfer protein [Schistocerca nitens]